MPIVDLSQINHKKQNQKLGKMLKEVRQAELLTSLAEAATILVNMIGRAVTLTTSQEEFTELLQGANALIFSIARGYGWKPEKQEYALILQVVSKSIKGPDGKPAIEHSFAFQGHYAPDVLRILEANNPGISAEYVKVENGGAPTGVVVPDAPAPAKDKEPSGD